MCSILLPSGPHGLEGGNCAYPEELFPVESHRQSVTNFHLTFSTCRTIIKLSDNLANRMPTLLIKNAYIVTMDDRQREIPEGGLFMRDGFIEQVGAAKELPQSADEVLDLKGYVVLPGLINTHHHFYQTLTRAVPAAQDANLFNWLKTLYPIWARMNADDIFISTQTALAELALSGCTTASDHLYLFPNGSKLDDEIAAAQSDRTPHSSFARLDVARRIQRRTSAGFRCG